ncbi:MAG TPA: hypothetical protein VH482_00955 [Thermomicrobiales bacterium]|jgi:hypothetical protein
MKRRIDVPSALLDVRARALKTLRAVGASTLLTMRLFDVLPESAARPRTAIVRELTLGGIFDPREVLPNGMVLTLPLEANSANRRERLAEFGPN